MKAIEGASLGLFFGYVMISVFAFAFYPMIVPFLRIFIDVIIATYMGLYGMKFALKLAFIEALLTSVNMIQADIFVSNVLPINPLLPLPVQSVLMSLLTSPIFIFLFSVLVFTVLDFVSSIALYFALSKIGFIRRVKVIFGK